MCWLLGGKEADWASCSAIRFECRQLAEPPVIDAPAIDLGVVTQSCAASPSPSAAAPSNRPHAFGDPCRLVRQVKEFGGYPGLRLRSAVRRAVGLRHHVGDGPEFDLVAGLEVGVDADGVHL
jgi:hypothetical protein